MGAYAPAGRGKSRHGNTNAYVKYTLFRGTHDGATGGPRPGGAQQGSTSTPTAGSEYRTFKKTLWVTVHGEIPENTLGNVKIAEQKRD